MSASVFNFKRIANATRFSLLGLAHLARHEAAFRQEVVLFAVLLLGGWAIGFSFGDQCLQVTLMCLILVTEALNTAAEKIVDRISTDHHPLSGTIKDIGSAAVLISFIPLVLFWAYALVTLGRGAG